MRPTNNFIGGGFGGTPSPCFHQYEKIRTEGTLTLYICAWCNHNLLKFGDGSKSSNEDFKPSPGGGKSTKKDTK